MEIDKSKLYKYISKSYVYDLKKKLTDKILSRKNVSKADKEKHLKMLDENIWEHAIDERCQKPLNDKSFEYLCHNIASDITLTIEDEFDFHIEDAEVAADIQLDSRTYDFEVRFKELPNWTLQVLLIQDLENSNLMYIEFCFVPYNLYENISFSNTVSIKLDISQFIKYDTNICLGYYYMNDIERKLDYILNHEALAFYQFCENKDYNFTYISEKEAKRYMKYILKQFKKYSGV